MRCLRTVNGESAGIDVSELIREHDTTHVDPTRPLSLSLSQMGLSALALVGWEQLDIHPRTWMQIMPNL